MVMLGAYVFLTWVCGLGDLVTTPTRYLLLSVGMAVLLYIAAIDRTEVEVGVARQLTTDVYIVIYWPQFM